MDNEKTLSTESLFSNLRSASLKEGSTQLESYIGSKKQIYKSSVNSLQEETSAWNPRSSCDSNDRSSTRDEIIKVSISTSAASLESKKLYLDKFLTGYKRFRSNYFLSDSVLFNSLRNSQAPKSVVVGCCDSRVDPAIITDCDLGDLFIIRNVANLIAPYHPDGNLHGVSAALEYAVMILKVENIIVLGHSKCGGIEALMRGESEKFEFIGPWMSTAQGAKERTLKHFGDRSFEEQCKACEYASILNSLENLISYPWIKELLMTGRITISGWYFDFQHGELLRYNPDVFKFESVVGSDH